MIVREFLMAQRLGERVWSLDFRGDRQVRVNHRAAAITMKNDKSISYRVFSN